MCPNCQSVLLNGLFGLKKLLRPEIFSAVDLPPDLNTVDSLISVTNSTNIETQ